MRNWTRRSRSPADALTSIPPLLFPASVTASAWAVPTPSVRSVARGRHAGRGRTAATTCVPGPSHAAGAHSSLLCTRGFRPSGTWPRTVTRAGCPQLPAGSTAPVRRRFAAVRRTSRMRRPRTTRRRRPGRCHGHARYGSAVRPLGRPDPTPLPPPQPPLNSVPVAIARTCAASSGGTAFPTCVYWAVRLPCHG